MLQNLRVTLQTLFGTFFLLFLNSQLTECANDDVQTIGSLPMNSTLTHFQRQKLIDAHCIDTQTLLLQYAQISASDPEKFAIINETQTVAWCSNDLTIGDTQEETVTIIILLGVIFSFVALLVVCAVVYLFLLDKILACIKLVSLPSESSLCSQDSQAGVKIHSFANQWYPNAHKILLHSQAGMYKLFC